MPLSLEKTGNISARGCQVTGLVQPSSARFEHWPFQLRHRSGSPETNRTMHEGVKGGALCIWG
jgi:hypothetical protein